MFGIDDIAVGAIAGGALSFLGGERANSANAAMANRQMDFQERMSSSAHQREVKDLVAAGLNPMLSAGGSGSSSPSGASAPQSDTTTPAVNSALNARASGLSARANEAQIAKTNADTDLTTISAHNEGMKQAGIMADNSAKVAQAGLAQLDLQKQRLMKAPYEAGDKIIKGVKGILSPLGSADSPFYSTEDMRKNLTTPFVNSAKYIEGLYQKAKGYLSPTPKSSYPGEDKRSIGEFLMGKPVKR
jgi:hypothetical protein